MSFPKNEIRNVAIIAHVDHGKTTLVDGLLKQAHTFSSHDSSNDQTTILDSNALERERGITILAKNTTVFWQDKKINIIDTPGHADFSGEVERVLNMADGVLLLVDSSEGVLSQTKFVLRLALKLKLKVIVLINKIDRKDQRIEEVKEEVNELFLESALNDEQLDFPVLYCIGRDGVAGESYEIREDGSAIIKDSQDLKPLFDKIINYLPIPKGELEGEFLLQVTNIEYDSYKGFLAIGKIARGKIKLNDEVVVLNEQDKPRKGKIGYMFSFLGLTKKQESEMTVGDIVALGLDFKPKIGDTICSSKKVEILPNMSISEPTVQIELKVSDSPLVGNEGKLTTERQISARLDKEMEKNVSMRLHASSIPNTFIVAGRGELHLAILFEEMRREGFEFSVGRPQVIDKKIDDVWNEPYEELMIEVPEECVGIINRELGERKAVLKDMKTVKSQVRFDYEIKTAALIGLRSKLQTLTSGQIIMNNIFLEYRVKGEEFRPHRSGVFASSSFGEALSYDLRRLQDRGTSYVVPGDKVYPGMIIGEHNRTEDIYINVCKGKKATNVRSQADVLIRLNASKKMTLEESLAFLSADEFLEITPISLRLRKKDLTVRNS
jgi:GTP-binding protein